MAHMAHDTHTEPRTGERALSRVIALFALVLGAFLLMTGLSMMFGGVGFPAVATGTVGTALTVVGGAQYRATLSR